MRRAGLWTAIFVVAITAGPACAQHPQPLTPAWLAARARGAAASSLAGSQSVQSAAAVRQSLADMQKAAQAIAALRPAPAVAASTNGLAAGWLAPDTTQTWLNVAKPTQTSAGATTTVTVKQTSQTAVAYWQSFNVGSQTNLVFDQSAGGTSANTWVVMNRVTNPAAVPSQILGSITAQGQVYIINRNGVIFGSGSQVNTASLLASTLDFNGNVAGFLANGIYSQASGANALLAAFAPDGTAASTATTGTITVQQGAVINTLPATSSESRGGFVLLMGSSVLNSGTITAPGGQIVLAAGQTVTVTPGYSSSGTGDPLATTLGMQVAVNSGATAGGGLVTNDIAGLLTASTGDITMVGETVAQNGIVMSTTTTGQRGTIHLLNPLNDLNSSVTLGPNSVTVVLPDLTDTTTALNSQRTQLIATSATDNALRLSTSPLLNDVAELADQLAQSRIEISSGHLVNFQAGSLTMAQGGQIAVAVGPLSSTATGTGRIFTGTGAILDVSGVPNVTLPLSDNFITVNIQSNEVRDSPGNRIAQSLAGDNVVLNINTLTLVPATTAYPAARDYTGGGLLEVSGYVSNLGHTIGEWSTVGGSIVLSAPQIVAQTGSVFNLAGGSIAYESGYVPQTWLTGTDGQLYNVNIAPATLTYSGIYSGFTTKSARWGITDTYSTGAVMPSEIFQAAYTVGRDAGSLTLSAPTAIFAATIDAGVVGGLQQTAARPSAVTDSLLLSQATASRDGSLSLGRYNSTGLDGVFTTGVALGAAVPADAAALSATAAVPADAAGAAWLSAGVLNGAALGGLSVAVAGSVNVVAPIGFAPGASVSIVAPVIQIAANLALPGGSLSLTNQLVAGGATSFLTTAGKAGITIDAATTISAGGTWTNLLLDPVNVATAGFAAGGSVTIDSSQGVSLLAGSIVDVSGGGTMSAAGKLSGGKGGSVSVTADDPASGAVTADRLVLQGSLTGYGVGGGGTLKLTAPSVQIGAASGTPAGASTLVLDPSLFTRGFTGYQIDGQTGLTVTAGTDLTVVAPGYQQSAAAATLPSGSDPSLAYTQSLLPLFTPNPVTAVMAQRTGASLTLSATQNTAGGAISIGAGATVQVDPGQSVGLTAYNSISVLGSVVAPGGAISITNTRYQDGTISTITPRYVAGQSIWIGGNARLDAGGTAVTALDQAGLSYGIVQNGGSITIGGVGGTAGDGTTRTTAEQIIIRPGAVLNASGARGLINARAGTGGASSGLETDALSQAGLVGGTGGSISLSSYSGIFTGGTMRAAGGSLNAAGGSLSLTMETPVYDTTLGNPPVSIVRPAEIIVSATPVTVLPATMAFGDTTNAGLFAQAYISTAQVAGGGFGTVALGARGLILFNGDVGLTAAQSITLSGGILAQTGSDAKVRIEAPYVRLAGLASTFLLTGDLTPNITNAWQYAATAGTGVFSVKADQIDVSNDIRFGTGASVALPGGGTFAVAGNGFADVRLVSSGALRFLSASGQNSPSGSTTIITSANVELTGAQIYPASGAVATVVAGLDFSAAATANALPETGRLLISGAGSSLAPPLSVGGSLTLAAGTVIQDGTVIAPEGSVTLGASGSLTAFGVSAASRSSKVTLLPGSYTSVSAYGLTIPYGGTADSISYSYDGGSVGAFHPAITLAGEAFTVSRGATLDLRGGGTLTGGTGELLTTAADGTASLASQGFVSGRGGSTDVLVTPLLQFNAPAGTVKAPTLSADPVYAIVAGAQSGYAPVTPLDTSSAYYGSLPKAGATITIGAGVPGLPAGTYTLLPSYYAVQPGGYRVELSAGSEPASGAQAVGNGTYLVAGYSGISNTSVRGAAAIPVYVTPAAAVESYSQFDQQGFSAFLTAQAASYNDPRPILPQDAGTLILSYNAGIAAVQPLTFNGSALFTPAAGGYGGTVAVVGSQKTTFEITGPNGPAGTGAVAISAAALDAIGAPRLVIGGTVTYNAGSAGTAQQPTIGLSAAAQSVTVDSGALLAAPDVFLLATSAAKDGSITVQDGATIDTIGTGAPPYDTASTGLSFDVQRYTALLLSNGNITLAPVNLSLRQSSGPLTIADGAALYSSGTIIASSENVVSIGTGAKFGSASINLTVPVVNIGIPSDASVPVPTGLTLQQSVLNTLLGGDTGLGVPALSSLQITASSAVNIYGSVNLTTTDPVTGKSSLAELILNTPAIYGQGTAGDAATITTGTLVWNGVTKQGTSGATSVLPSGVITGGAGTGLGSLTLQANEIVLGYPAGLSPGASVTVGRTMFGFSAVNLVATSEIQFNNQSTLSVYAAQQGIGFTGTGGNLNIVTPLLTGASGAQFAITAGGAVTFGQQANAAGVVTPSAQGATFSVTAASISANTDVLLPAGTISMLARAGDIAIGSKARLSVAGPSVALFDQMANSPGGSVALESTAGNITLAAGSVVDVSSSGAAAGSLSLTAVAGSVTADGILAGTGVAGRQQGSLTVRAMSVPDFRGLVTAADTDGFTGALSFDIGSGNLSVGAVKAEKVSISASGGNLTVTGTIDAGGAAPGSITLAALNALEITGTAVLDAHATVAQVAAANRADVSLTARAGTLTLDPGATIDVSNASGTNYGTVEIYAPRTATNGVKISASGALNISGAESIALYAMRTYTAGDGVIPSSTVTNADGSTTVDGTVTQAVLTTIGNQNTAFMNAAVANANLLTAIAGLDAPLYAGVFHLRPGVEIDSTANGGSLTVRGDLTMNAMRYASLNGAGTVEPGVLTLRAAGKLNIFGSISDGFGAPTDIAAAPNPDDNGWQLLAGREPLGQDVVVPVSVDLAATSSFDTTTGATLNYAISIGAAVLKPDVLVPATVTLAGQYVIPAGGVVAAANVYNAAGTLAFAKGSLIPGGFADIGKGWSLAAGSVMPFALHLQAGTTWPAGAALSSFQSTAVKLQADVMLQPGDLIPAGTLVVPGGKTVTSVALRPSIAYGGVQGGATVAPSATSIQGAVLATAPLLINSQSWSIHLAGGANLASANSGAVQAGSVLAASNNQGGILLSDTHYVDLYTGKSNALSTAHAQAGLSVIRTGTGDLSLTAGGNINEASLYGIYTAGTQPTATAAAYNLARGTLVGGSSVLSTAGTGSYNYNTLLTGYSAWYPSGGGNVQVSARGTVSGDVLAVASSGNVLYQSDAVGNWLWRQGGAAGQATAWWINFGAYADNTAGGLELVGFSGIGALGGGNVTVNAGGNAGNLVTDAASTNHSTAIDAVIASTGQVVSAIDPKTGVSAPTGINETGGGNLTIDVGGTLNPANTSFGGNGLGSQMFGVVGNLRGSVDISAGAIGRIIPSSSVQAAGSLVQSVKDAAGGPLLVLGDATATINTEGNLVLGGVIDPGRVNTANTTAYVNAVTGARSGGGRAAFTLWHDSTAIDLYTAGGTLIPTMAVSGVNIGADMNIMYPPTLIATAATGNIIYAAILGSATALSPALELAPAPSGQLELLAGGSIDAAGLSTRLSLGIDISGAPAGIDNLPTPYRPAWQGSYPGTGGSVLTVSNVTDSHDLAGYTSLFAFEADSADAATTALHANDPLPALIYAAGGDIVDLGFGETRQYVSGSTVLAKWYIAAKPAEIRASNDILVTGTPSLLPTQSTISSSLKVTRDLILNINPGDVSTITAGRDIFYANVAIAGPGTLEVIAGRNLYQANQGSFYSVGVIIDPTAATQTNGAGIAVLAGAGSSGPDWSNFLNLYFSPANQADPTLPLSDAANAGKVAGDYAGSAALVTWMNLRFPLANGTSYTAAGATSAFEALPTAQQTPFLLQAYFAELVASVVEYDTIGSLRYQSYLRGDEANASLWGAGSVTPTTSILAGLGGVSAASWAQEIPTLTLVAAPAAASTGGDITLYGGSGITTQLGGAITALAPNGQIVLGLASVPPPTPASGQPAAGLIAADTGDVNIYTHDSLILGQSRGFAIGGNLTVWAATGDISVGVGSKTTTVFQAPRIDYDIYGDITLAPVAPTSGAGLATLAPTPEVPAGDVVLATRFGVIDLGEAGVRSSKTIRIAGRIVGTGGLTAAGGVSGGAAVSAPSVGAPTSAPPPAGSSGPGTLSEEDRRKRRREIPSLITVEVVSFGGDGGP